MSVGSPGSGSSQERFAWEMLPAAVIEIVDRLRSKPLVFLSRVKYASDRAVDTF